MAYALPENVKNKKSQIVLSRACNAPVVSGNE